jgi:tRNA(Ile)-lysidine synthase
VLHSLKRFFKTEGTSRTYYMAYSGGLDSHVLLHLCAGIRNELPLKLCAVYINHMLSPYATQWSKHCEKMCKSLNIDFLSITINAQSMDGESPEETARLSRYAAFTKLLQSNDFLLTAHQQDDQAETVLLQLFRGAGPKGLAAMPKIKPFGKGFHARPLLDFTRNELKQYAEKNQLQWIEDESNTNTHFTRNFLRHEIIPLLKTRWPTLTKTLSRSAEHCAEASHIIDEVAEKDLAGMTQRYETLQVLHPFDLVPQSISHDILLKPILALTPARQRYVLRAWFNQLNFPIPSAIKLKQIQQDFFTAREDKSPYMQWKNVELRRYKNKLYVMQCLAPHNSLQSFVWDLKKPLFLPNIGELRTTLINLTIKEVLVRFRQGDETCQLPGRHFHHELKKLFQIWNIPPWERDRIPLIFLEDKLIAVVGYFYNHKDAVSS